MSCAWRTTYARVASRGPWRVWRRRPSGDSIATSKQLHVVYSCGWPTPGSAGLSPGAPLAEFDLNRATDAARALAVLVEARLVVVSDEMAEVALRGGLREWPRRDWLEEDAHGRRLHRHLTQTSTAWDEVVVTRRSIPWRPTYHGARLGRYSRPRLERPRAGLRRAEPGLIQGQAVEARRTNRGCVDFSLASRVSSYSH